MGRATQEQAAKNRATIVAAASRLIRERGVDGVGVRELMASAGLTQGAFAGQFGSKEALVAEACAHAFEAAEHALVAVSEGDAAGQAERIAASYLAAKPSEFDCPMATLAADTARTPADSPMRGAFTAGLERLVPVVAGDPSSPERLALLAAMVGAAVLRRASNNDVLAGEIEAAVVALGRNIA